MSWSTFFTQECPTCGRRLQIRVRNLGKSVRCQHCHAGFTARDPHSESGAMLDPVGMLLEKADDYLASVDDPRVKPR